MKRLGSRTTHNRSESVRCSHVSILYVALLAVTVVSFINGMVFKVTLRLGFLAFGHSGVLCYIVLALDMGTGLTGYKNISTEPVPALSGTNAIRRADASWWRVEVKDSFSASSVKGGA